MRSPKSRPPWARRAAALMGSRVRVQFRHWRNPEAQINKHSAGAETSSEGDWMTYCLEWRLVGRASRLLDHGEIDGDLADRASALQALHAFLLTFAVRGRNDAEDYWWGRRSADADLEVQVVLRRTVKRDAGHNAGPILISTRTNHKGGEHDIRRTEPAAQGRGGPQGADCDQADPPWGMAPRPGSVGRTSPGRAPAFSG